MKFEFSHNINTEKESSLEWVEKVKKYYHGEMHAHSKRSDRSEIGGVADGKLHQDRRLMQYAEKLGLDFVVFSEHASNTGRPHFIQETHPICRSLIEQQSQIDDINISGKYSSLAFSAVEASIFFDDDNQASLDVPDSVLSRMDLVIASRHGIKDQRDPEKIKESLLAAINHPEVDIIGHPYRGIEFYKNDWNFFKKYFTKDNAIFSELQGLEDQKRWNTIKQIIGKTELTDDKRIKELHNLFASLYEEYWEMWEDVLDGMEKEGKAFEINLNVFDPNKSFYQDLLKKAVLRKSLVFSISFDFHNLTQQKNFKEDKDSEEIAGIKNHGREKAVQRLLSLINILENLGVEPDRIINSSLENLNEYIDTRKKMRNEAVLEKNGYEAYLNIENLSQLLKRDISSIEVEEAVIQEGELVRFLVKCRDTDGVDYYFRKNDDYDLKRTFDFMNLIRAEMPDTTNMAMHLSNKGDVLAYQSLLGETGVSEIKNGDKERASKLAVNAAILLGELHALDLEKFNEYVNMDNYDMERIRSSISIDLIDTISDCDKNLGKELNDMYSDLVRHEKDILDKTDLVLIHGDFHPGNILFDERGSVKLIDFKNATKGVKERDIASMIEQVYAQCEQGEGGVVDSSYIKEWQELFLNSYEGNFDKKKVLFYRSWISYRNSIYCFSKYYLGKNKKIDVDNGNLFLKNAKHYLEDYKKLN